MARTTRMGSTLMQSGFDWGLLTKQFVFGAISAAMSLLVVSGFFNVGAAMTQHDARKVRLSIARAMLKFGVTVVMVEPLLAVLGVPDLPLLDWHVLMLIIGSVITAFGALGVIVLDDDWRPPRERQ